MSANKFSIGELRGVHVSSIVNESIKTISTKPTNKTKTSKQKITKATIFRAQKLPRGLKLFVLTFDAFYVLKIFS